MKRFILLLFALLLMWLGGFSWYIHILSQGYGQDDQHTEGIVVLTGGKDRLAQSVQLLEQGMASKLFISGVDARVSHEELTRILATQKKLMDCCIESDRKALNTVGNAEETALWVIRNNIHSLRVVTSLEHMPRALVELRRFMPGIKLLAHPVGTWRPENMKLQSLLREYSKYIVSLFRARALDIMMADTDIEGRNTQESAQKSSLKPENP